jgi:photosystem II stability/assembly factor-like uncharacterized protein
VLHEAFIFRSLDRGLTWEKIMFTEFSYMRAIAFKDSKNGYIVGDGGRFAYTDDGGTSWFKGESGVPTSFDLHDIKVLPGGRLFVVGDATIMYSDNSGQNWTKIPFTEAINRPYEAIAHSASSNGFVVGAAGFILHTTDGWQTWEVQKSGIRYPEDTTAIIFLRDVYIADSAIAWAVGDAGSILHTNNGGKSWVAPNLPGLQNSNSQVFPNPSNGILYLSFTMPLPEYVTLEILSISGVLVETAFDHVFQLAGEHIIPLNLAYLSSGQYAYRLTSPSYQSTGILTIVK